MTAASHVRRPGPLLGPGAGGAVALILSIAVLSLAASLILIDSLAVVRGALEWRSRLTGAATVVVRGAGLESPDAAAARAADVLVRTPGVARASPLDPAAADEAIARLVDGGGAGAGPARLIAVDFKAGARPSAAALTRALKADGLHAEVDDHQPLTGPVARAASAASLAAGGVLAALALVAGVITAFITGRRVAARAELTTLLRLAGAADGFIGGLFTGEAARGAALGGVTGAAAAALAVAAWRLTGHGPAAAGASAFAWSDLAAVLPWPFIAALAGAIGARLAVRVALKGAP